MSACGDDLNPDEMVGDEVKDTLGVSYLWEADEDDQF